MAEKPTDQERAQKMPPEADEEAEHPITNAFLESIFYYSTGDAVIATDMNLRILFYNKKAEVFFGYREAEVIGKSVWEMHLKKKVEPERLEKALEEIQEKGVYEYDVEGEDPQGEKRWLHSLVTPLRNKNGQQKGYVLNARDVTQQRMAEESLKESEEKYRFLAETMADIVWTTDLEFKTTYCSPSVEKVLGFTPDDHYRMTAEEKITPDSFQRATVTLLNFLKQEEEGNLNQEVAKIDTEYYTKNGSTVWMENSVQFIRDSEDKITGLLGVSRCIKERRKMEETLRESESRFRTLMEQSPNMIFINQMGSVVYANKVCEDRLGYTKNELYASDFDFQSLIAPESMETVASAFKNHTKGIEVPPMDYILVDKTGRTMDTIISTKLIEYKGEKAILGVATDITRQKQTEKKLRESEEKFRILTEASPMGIALLNRDGRYKYINPKFVEIFGYQIDEISTGKIWFKKAFPDETYRREVISTWLNDKDKAPEGESRPRIYKAKCKDGSEKVINFQPVTLITGDQLVICEDISEAKHMEAQFQQAMKMEAIGTLAGGIAHEFNNILGIIIGNTELAIDDVPEWNPARDCLKEIRTASLRAKDVVRQIMSFARKTPATQNPMNIGSIVTQSLKLIRASIPAGIDIRREILCESEMIMGNPTEISQILMNLCSNSAHAMEDDMGILKVKLETVTLNDRCAARFQDLKPGDYVKLIVTDTGSGIAPENMDRIMDPYFTTKDVDKGLGMGLAVVFGLVKKHGGAINIESEVEKGTTVEVWFPFTKELSEPKDKIVKDLPTGTERILFVDDEPSLVKLVRQMLQRQGYQVVCKTSSTEALEQFQAHPDQFDLVITDMAMPGISGDRLAKECIRIRPDIPVVLCTGHSDRIDKYKAENLGIKAFVLKPLKKSDLLNTVRKLLDETKDDTQQ